MTDNHIDPALSHAVVRYVRGPLGTQLPYRSWSKIQDVAPEYRGQAATIVREIDYMLSDWHYSHEQKIERTRQHFASSYPQLDTKALDALEALARWMWR